MQYLLVCVTFFSYQATLNGLIEQKSSLFFYDFGKIKKKLINKKSVNKITDLLDLIES